ncbi:hypothetical protein M2306_002880 [Myroides gitamensis]|nr:hypothetical protein [Myroides odoratus]MDH6602186.1 hypothetical protein [Myroides gitamensis]
MNEIQYICLKIIIFVAFLSMKVGVAQEAQ